MSTYTLPGFSQVQLFRPNHLLHPNSCQTAILLMSSARMSQVRTVLCLSLPCDIDTILNFQHLSEYHLWWQALSQSRVCPPPEGSWSLATSTPASQIWPVTSTSVPLVTGQAVKLKNSVFALTEHFVYVDTLPDIFLQTVPEAHPWQQPQLVLEPSHSSNRLWYVRLIPSDKNLKLSSHS